MTDMDMPLPEPAHTQVETYSGIALNKVVETPLFTADQLRAYGEAVRAEERERFKAWIDKGEELMKLKENASAMFSLGRWWGERPWRK